MSQIGLLIVLTGPTASGKDAIMHKLLDQNPTWSRIITTTTRPPRNNEIDGKDYHFIDQKSFQDMQKNGKFLETINYSGNYYGTTKQEIERIFSGETLIWRIDPTMAAQVEEYFSKSFPKEKALQLIANTKVFFITVPDIEMLYRRIKERGMDETSVRKRLKQDSENWDSLNLKFKNIIMNPDGALDESVEKILNLLNN